MLTEQRSELPRSHDAEHPRDFGEMPTLIGGGRLSAAKANRVRQGAWAQLGVASGI
jgi:hypothetical protein